MIGTGRRRRELRTTALLKQSRESHEEAHQLVLTRHARYHDHVLLGNARFAGQKADQFVVGLAALGHGGHLDLDRAVVENAAPFCLRTLGDDADFQRQLLGGGETGAEGYGIHRICKWKLVVESRPDSIVHLNWSACGSATALHRLGTVHLARFLALRPPMAHSLWNGKTPPPPPSASCTLTFRIRCPR